MKAGWSMNADEKTPPGSPQEWLRHAESDLLLAKLGADNEDVLTAQVCFHAQQAIEKALKGLLIQRGLRFPPVHDLEQLLEIAQRAKIDLPDWAEELLDVTPYAVETRYPGYWDDILPAERDRALELATMTLAWVRQYLGRGERSKSSEGSESKEAR